MENLEGLNITPPTTINILDLPRDIIVNILFQLYANGDSIIGFITSCKSLFISYEYLIYATKVVKIKEMQNIFKKFPNNGDNTNNIHILCKIYQRKETIAPSISVLKLRSNISRALLNNSKIPTSFTSLIPKTLPFCTNLIILDVQLDSILLFVKLMNSLPEKLKVLAVNFTMKSNLNFTKVNLPSLEKEFSNGSNIKILTNLLYFTVSSSFKNIGRNHIHPELGIFHYSPYTFEEQSSERNKQSHLVKLFQSIRNLSSEQKVKKLLGKIFYKFLTLNGDTLIKIEANKFDLSLVFCETRPPFNFPKLRMLFFDNVSRVNMNEWLVEFQLVNSKATYKAAAPILLMHDSLGDRLYFKSSDHIRSRLNNESEIIQWESTTLVRAKYAIVLKDLDLYS